MLPLAFIRSGFVRAMVPKQTHSSLVPLFQARAASTYTAPTAGNELKIKEGVEETPEMHAAKSVFYWDQAHEKFFGPDRDYKRFPHPVQPPTAGKVRMAFIPEEWFTFMYPKTGVLGPYIFGTGLVTYLFSKEIWVIDHGFADLLALSGAVYLLTRWVGPYIREMLDETSTEARAVQYEIPLKRAKNFYTQKIDHCDKEVYRVGAQKYIDEAKRENVDLQLEAEYRRRLAEVHKKIKDRLDYVLDKQTTERNIQQDHMVDWIVQNVRSSITPEQEKNSITKCIQDLQSLAKNQGKGALA